VNTLKGFEAKYSKFVTPAVLLYDAVSWVWDVTDHVKYQELQGMVQGIDSKEMDMPKAVLLNSVYEIGAWCTSIIAKQSDGTIIHSRNLDYNNDQDDMRTITYRAKFVEDGEYKFDAVMFAGTIGVYTGMRTVGTGEGATGFSISQNTRYFNKNPLLLLENLSMMWGGFEEQSWLVRKTLAECDNFQCAHKMLATHPVDAMGYYILAGDRS
jgi:N-acylethanolamine-hydrolysing acid amidase